MAAYSTELKAQIVKKMMPLTRQTVATPSRQTGNSAPTMYAWRKQFQDRGFVAPNKPSNADHWDARVKPAAVVRTASMNETERSMYWRERGLYVEQLDAWEQAFDAVRAPDDEEYVAAVNRRNRRLQKELRRMERALAEAAAVLSLSHKADAIWAPMWTNDSCVDETDGDSID